MGNISTYLSNEILDHIFGNGAYTPPTNIFVALSTTPPTDSGGNVTPPSGNGYARKQTAAADWAAASNRALANAADIEFAEASGDWGEITHFALYDAISGGNFLAWGTLSTPKTYGNGDTARFKAGTLTVQVNASA